MQSEPLAAALEEAQARKGKGIFKRRKAKGPNPLAMKKGKKTKTGAPGTAGSQQKPHRKRVRRRGRDKAADGAGNV